MSKELSKSSFSGAAQVTINLALSMVSIPIFVAKLGLVMFGLFSIVTLLGNLNALSNLGLNTFLVQFLAEKGKCEDSDRHIVVTMGILALVLAPVTSVCLILRDEILISVLSVPIALLNDAQLLFDCVLIANVFIVIGQVFSAILDSQQKVYLTNIWQTVYNAMYWSLILLAIFLGQSLRGISIAIVVSAILWFFLLGRSAFTTWGMIRTGGFRKELVGLVRNQLSFGVPVYFSGLANILYEPLTKILVSRWIGIREVAILDVGLKAKNAVYYMVSKLFYPLFPFLASAKDPGRIRRIVHDASQKGVLIAVPLSILVLLTSEPLVALLFHQDMQLISLSVTVFLVSYLLCSVPVIPVYLYLLARGQVKRTLNAQIINAVVNVTLLYVFHESLGYVAVLVSGSVAIASSFVYLLTCQKRFLDSLVFDSTQQVVEILASALLAFALGGIAASIIESHFARLVVVGIIVTSTTIVFYRYRSMLSADDIVRYLGDHVVSRFASRLLCR